MRKCLFLLIFVYMFGSCPYTCSYICASMITPEMTPEEDADIISQNASPHTQLAKVETLVSESCSIVATFSEETKDAYRIDPINIMLAEINLLIIRYMQRYGKHSDDPTEDQRGNIEQLSTPDQKLVRGLTAKIMMVVTPYILSNESFEEKPMHILVTQKALESSLPWLITQKSSAEKTQDAKRSFIEQEDSSSEAELKQEGPSEIIFFLGSNIPSRIFLTNLIKEFQQKRDKRKEHFTALLKEQKLDPYIEPLPHSSSSSAKNKRKRLRTLWARNIELLAQCYAEETEIFVHDYMMDYDIHCSIPVFQEIITKQELRLLGWPMSLELSYAINPAIRVKNAAICRELREENKDIDKDVQLILERLGTVSDDIATSSGENSTAPDNLDNIDKIEDLISYMNTANANLEWLLEKLEVESKKCDEQIARLETTSSVLHDFIRKRTLPTIDGDIFKVTPSDD